MILITTMTTSASLRAARTSVSAGFCADPSGAESARSAFAGLKHEPSKRIEAVKPAYLPATTRLGGKRRSHRSRFSPHLLTSPV